MLAGQCCSGAASSVEALTREGLWRVEEGGMVVRSPKIHFISWDS